VNREEELSKIFPTSDGTTYIQSIDRYHSNNKNSNSKDETKEDNRMDNHNTDSSNSSREYRVISKRV
jgi:hypothetical protein